MDAAIQSLRMALSESCPNVEVLGQAGNIVDAAKLIRQIEPDVVFLDVELEDGTGFDLLEILPDIDFKVIFITGSDEHALRAFRFSAVDYLLKPIIATDLKSSVDKINVPDSRENVEILLEQWQQSERRPRITLRNSDEIKIVSLAEIVRCQADNNYTTFVLTDGTKFLVSKTLKTYASLLQDHSFMRVHQSHLINLSHVSSFVRSEGGYLLMDDGTRVPVALRKRAHLSRWLDQL